MSQLVITIIFPVIVAAFFAFRQYKYYCETRKYRSLFSDFFKREKDYAKYAETVNNEEYPQLVEVGMKNSDLNDLIREINYYVIKTKGTTDFSTIQNKVERKLNMRYDQSVTHLAFPTYIGLMGTFTGVFMGIIMFLRGFDDAGNISDDSIRNLLAGILVSMATSLLGLWLTTKNHALAGDAKKNVEEEKNKFYDFVQTELMPTINVSMVSAINKLHETVDKFEPSFDRVINRFQNTFDSCTDAFGKNFEKNVSAVAVAVKTMGANMDKINENIQYQKELIQTMKSDQVATGMDKYIEAAHQFVSITQSLDKFEQARRMMLAAAQETINIQKTYADSLKVPLDIAVNLNKILDRITTFETNLNQLGEQLNKREMLGNDVLQLIKDQVSAIEKKQNIASDYIDSADNKLADLYDEQTRAITKLNQRYKDAISDHIDGFEKMLKKQTEDLETRHNEFIKAMEERLSIEDIRAEFISLRKLSDIDQKAADIEKKTSDIEKKTTSIDHAITMINEAKFSALDVKRAVAEAMDPIKSNIDSIKNDIDTIKADLKKKQEERTGGFGSFFGNRR